MENPLKIKQTKAPNNHKKKKKPLKENAVPVEETRNLALLLDRVSTILIFQAKSSKERDSFCSIHVKDHSHQMNIFTKKKKEKKGLM